MLPSSSDAKAPPSYKQRVAAEAKDRLWGFVICLILIGLYLCAKPIYLGIESAVDDSGWVQHSYDTPVWIGGDWLVNEYRVCKTQIIPGAKLPESAHLLCGRNYVADEQSWPADFINSISSLGLDSLMESKWDGVEQNFHVLPVRYWGRIDRYERISFAWRCQRQTTGLECKAIN